jgi:hypothetical protein
MAEPATATCDRYLVGHLKYATENQSLTTDRQKNDAANVVGCWGQRIKASALVALAQWLGQELLPPGAS